jgi:hypothetical protein
MVLQEESITRKIVKKNVQTKVEQNITHNILTYSQKKTRNRNGIRLKSILVILVGKGEKNKDL